ncbi:hypothetical protein AB2I11_10690 [Escherichia coli]
MQSSQAIWQKAEPLFGDEPWWVRDLAKETGTDEPGNAPDATPGGPAGDNYGDR